MKFNVFAKELKLSVSELADKVSDILPNANGGTEVSDEQKAQIIALLQTPSADSALSLFTGDGSDPILSILMERIEEESQLETPERIADEMISRYLANPEDLPADSEYCEAIITYVDLVKKRQARRQQRSLRLRSRLSRNANAHSTVEPLALESFYSSEPNTDSSSATLNGSGQSPQLAAASS
jgi:hypothetical protein